MNEIIDNYRKERELRGISPKTLQSEIFNLKYFLSFCKDNNLSLFSLNTCDFELFFNNLKYNRNCSKSTQKNYFIMLKHLFRYLKIDNFKDYEVKAINNKIYSIKKVEHYDILDLETYKNILREILKRESRTGIRDALIIKILWETGCTRSEVVKLQNKDFALETGILRIKNRKGYLNNKDRNVIVSENTVKLINKYVFENVKKGPNDYIFQNEKNMNGNPVKPDFITHVFKTAVDTLKDNKIIPKDKNIVLQSLRYGRAQELYDKGVAIENIKTLLGSKYIETILKRDIEENKNKVLEDIQKLL
ncbi:putative integrase/recombinase (plasmid) [Methanococcus maripaludis C5]|uniref:Putative integrase/recombinase n=1 Tax=Methanococcus maripaludis (strain C5 / ATCC BAA-1333) TaxID=402880 RepID=O06108_METM5|nr:site-specific integrase [Methanococcus maripaludis]AAC45247.1 unknown [Methanococcus maripaludis C5]ABO36137.1 putative integrase/recombinase [Methanococcus maripaludis C5]